MILYLTLAWLTLRILGGVLLWRYLGVDGCKCTPPYAPTVGLRSQQSAAPLGLN